MIRDAKDFNATVAPNTRDLERLRTALPEFFSSDGAFMVDRLEETLQSDDVRITREGYELKFLGKSYGKFQSSTRTETVIVPDEEHNSKDENANSENLYIVGDNLDALKHLLHSYSGKVKCIYIDPPYNTGTDGFVYNDSFGFSDTELVEKLGIGADEAKRILNMHGKSSHSAWLTFMLPRLLLARDLLSDDGVIFISIDENEQANLTLLCDEIFGESQRLANLAWQKKKGGGNDSTHIAVEHESVLVYTRSRSDLAPIFLPYDGPYLRRYNEEDEHGKYYWDTFKRKSGKQYYPITCPDGSVLEHDEFGAPISWLRSEKTFQQNLKDGEVRFIKNSSGNWSVHFKQRLAAGKKPRSILNDAGTTSSGSSEAQEILRGNFFENPKPVALVKHLLGYLQSDDSIVIDFFSGSATTAHAVMQLNAEENANRKFILVQLPDEIDASKPAYEAGYRTIDEIGRERIRRAAAKIREETGANFDSGFRLVRLHTPANKTVADLEAFDPEARTDLFAEDMTERFTTSHATGKDAVLATWLNQDGFGMHAKTQQVPLDEYAIDVIDDSAYIVSPGFGRTDAEKLVQLLESGELPLRRLVVFGYNIDYSAKAELVANLKNPKSGRAVELIVRF